MNIALLRGINVGGHGKLPMADLRRILADLGAKCVATYIQSGNAVFDGDVTGKSISAAIETEKGFYRDCIVITSHDLARAIAENPFPEAQTEPKSLHFGFLAGPPSPGDLDAAKAPKERWHLTERVFYLHTPGGLLHGKLAKGLDRRLGCPVTMRNWSTVSKLADMAGL